MAERKKLVGLEDVLGIIDEFYTLADSAVDNRLSWIEEKIKKLPPVEVVDVVRCKDCVGYHIVKGITTTYGWCGVHDHEADEDDFCSEGWKADAVVHLSSEDIAEEIRNIKKGGWNSLKG